MFPARHRFRDHLGRLARLITVAAGAAAGVALVGTAFVIAGVRAAKARREFDREGNGTTGQNLETLGNILRGRPVTVSR